MVVKRVNTPLPSWPRLAEPESATSGNIAKTAEVLGVSRPTLYDLMHRLAIK